MDKHGEARSEVLVGWWGVGDRGESESGVAGRGTFLLSGRPITDRETLDQMSMETYETAIEVPKAERAYYGATQAA